MLQKVIAQTPTPVSFDITDVDPDEILILKSISGLSKAGADLYMGDYAGEGSYYQGRRAKRRNPVLNFKINPDYANDVQASDIRNMLNRIFMEPNAESDGLQIAVFDDKFPELYFVGYTEDVDADQFSKELGAQVSMLCTDPYLRSAVETEGFGTGWLTVPIVYEGSADTGFFLEMTVQTSTPEIFIENNGKTMHLVHDFVAGDTIQINTQPRERSILINSADKMAVLQGSTWLKLSEKTNLLRVYGSVPGDGRVVVFHYKYRAAWWGI